MVTTLIQLRYFVAVADELSFTRAAERLHLSQPSLSAQVRSLEAGLGQPLFTRTTRRVELTPAGRELHERLTRVLGEIDDALRDARHGADARLRLACGAGLEPVLGLVRDELEGRGREVRGVPRDDDAVLGDVRECRADAGLVCEAGPTPGLRVETLHREPLAVFVGRAHPIARRDAIGAHELRGHPLAVAPGGGNGVARAARRLCGGRGLARVAPPAGSDEPAPLGALIARDPRRAFLGPASLAPAAGPCVAAVRLADADAGVSLDLVTRRGDDAAAVIGDAWRTVAARQGWTSPAPALG